MANPIGNIQRLVPGLIETVNPSGASGIKEVAGGKESFADLFSNLLESVNDKHSEMAGVQEAMFNGEPVELHEIMIKLEEAGLATDLLLEIRNKLVSAYSELMRMPM